VAINITGDNLIALERDEAAGPAVKIYQNLPQSSALAPIQAVQATVAPSPTAIPTSTPTPVPPTPTPTNTPLPTDTPIPTSTPSPTPTFELEIKTEPTISQTRTLDNAIEVLVSAAEDEANWFWIDQTEVTNGQYQICVESGVCPEIAGDYADLFYRADHPVVGINWQQAKTYCQWIGGNLPTVSQWRMAASPDSRIYPWGNTGPACQRAIINDTCDTDQPGTRPVGSKPDGASPFGVLDLIGNVWEWTATLGNKNDAHAILGGSWSNPDGSDEGGFDAFNPANIVSQSEAYKESNLGFRCMRAYEQTSTQ
jgi:formylglycine-generating enzyme required for sulfatase activity